MHLPKSACLFTMKLSCMHRARQSSSTFVAGLRAGRSAGESCSALSRRRRCAHKEWQFILTPNWMLLALHRFMHSRRLRGALLRTLGSKVTWRHGARADHEQVMLMSREPRWSELGVHDGKQAGEEAEGQSHLQQGCDCVCRRRVGVKLPLINKYACYVLKRQNGACRLSQHSLRRQTCCDTHRDTVSRVHHELSAAQRHPWV